MTRLQRTADLIEDPRTVTTALVVLLAGLLWTLIWSTMDRGLPAPLAQMLHALDLTQERAPPSARQCHGGP